ncbi:MAG: transcriptional regulator, TetR family [Anaerocolumna sp.]|jgi:AcrR family transcriptional regulator|nr:transcriptional regulator, TetR family [Anaerocolumna sp.]
MNINLMGRGNMKREEQKEQRKKQIMSVALDLFVKKGYAATKVSDIAKTANMSVGLLFHYFESKEKLLEELTYIGLQGTQMPLQMEYLNELDFYEKFTSQLIAYMQEQPITAKMFVFMAQMQRTEGIPENIKETALSVNTLEKSVDIIKSGQKKGIIRKGNPMALSNAYWCSIQGIAEQYAMHPDIPLPEAEWIVDIIRLK